MLPNALYMGSPPSPPACQIVKTEHIARPFLKEARDKICVSLTLYPQGGHMLYACGLGAAAQNEPLSRAPLGWGWLPGPQVASVSMAGGPATAPAQMQVLSQGSTT